MDKTIIITGATGFLGGWLVDHFLSLNYKIVTVINPNKTLRKNHLSSYYIKELDKKCTEHKIDISDQIQVKKLIKNEKPSAVIHLAAISDVTLCAQNPSTCFNVSALSTLNLLEAIRIVDDTIPLISHTTDKVYGENTPPFEEKMCLKPKHIYEVAKVTQEHLTSSYSNHYGLPTVSIRCGNYFGGYDFNFNRIIPYTIHQNIKKLPIELRSNGEFTRDFLYIEDAVLINQLLLDKLLNKEKRYYGEAFNFSLEIKIKMIDIIKKISNLMNIKPKIIINEKAKSEIIDMQLDCSKAKKSLDWAPKYNFEEGLVKTIDFYTNYLG